MAESTRKRGECIQIMFDPDEWDAVDDFRFKKRMPGRAAAVRVLLSEDLRPKDF
jgi:hypothetical protein